MTDREKLIKLINTFDNTVGSWLSAAIDDPYTCDELKQGIDVMFETIHQTVESIDYTQDRFSNSAPTENNLGLTEEAEKLFRNLIKGIP